MTAAALRSPAEVRVTFDGQSLCNYPDPPNNAPTLVMAGLGVPWANVALNGIGWYDLAGTVTTRRDPQSPASRAGKLDVLVMLGGQSDVYAAAPSGDQTGATIYDRAVSYATSARAAGFDRVLLCTLPPMGPNAYGLGIPTASQAQAITDFNTLALANSGGFEAVADLHVPPLDDSSSTTYYLDRLHWTAAGAVAAASIIRAALLPLLTP